MNIFKIPRLLLVLLLISTMLLGLCACGKDEKQPQPQPSQTAPAVTTVPPTTNQGVPEDAIVRTAFLGDNLYITDIGNYTGAYMEDGKNEFVSDILMIVLKNEGAMPLQLARISLEYSDFTAEFEVTNLPAGESVVLLEKNKHEYVSDTYLSAKAEDVVFFQQPMNLQADKVKITGSRGLITVENLTDQVLGAIYIFYKNSSVDLFYGGITYRARAEAGLKPGQSITVMTHHYNPSGSTILDVQILPTAE